MKKALALLMSLVFVCSAFVGCSEQPGAVTDDGKYLIGICQLLEHEALDAATEGFQAAVIEALGEENVVFDLQNAQNDSNTCSTIANQFVSDDVDLILANATPALIAASAATTEIPILGTSITEYGSALQIEDFNGTVGGNISGTSDLAPIDEQAQMVKDWFPEAKNIGLLYCSAEANSQYQVDEISKYLKDLGFETKLYPFSDSNDLASVCTTAANNSDVIYVPTDNTVASNTGIISNICQPANVPVIGGEEGICRLCGVAALSISYYDLGYTTGQMAVKILKGEANIAEMPVEYAPASKKYNKAIADELKLKAVEGYEALEVVAE